MPSEQVLKSSENPLTTLVKMLAAGTTISPTIFMLSQKATRVLAGLEFEFLALQ
jgi:hypothetical protein